MLQQPCSYRTGPQRESSPKPRYLRLYLTGELERRARMLEQRLLKCDICPRKCGINRLESEAGFCRSGRQPVVSSFCDHHGEEPAISGNRGSGTIFFGNCNLKCVYCQNHQISQPKIGMPVREVDETTLAKYMLYLQNTLGCHNINLVSPTHFVPQIVRALAKAIPAGLHIPLVYNTNSYDSLSTLQSLDGIIDIYLPDLKYSSDTCAVKFSRVPGYVFHARQAISEMYRQVGNLQVDEAGVAQRGVIVRHLVLPNDVAGSDDSLTWLASKISKDISISLMAQYSPRHHALRIPLLSRRVSGSEYRNVTGLLEHLGLANGWVQQLDSSDIYLPHFEREGHPFETN